MRVDIDIKQLDEMEPDIPCYCFQVEAFYQNIERFRTFLAPGMKVIFSAKANPFFIGAALNKFNGIEICSAGELRRAIKYRAAPEKIVYGGICKEMDDLDEMVKYGLRRFSVESLRQLEMLEKTASRHRVRVNALLRLSSGNQFGMSVSEYHRCIAGQGRKYTAISGIHFYPGTMRRTADDVKRDFDKFEGIVRMLDMSVVQEIFYGAGIAFDYYDRSHDRWAVAREIADRLNPLSRQYEVTYEAGRLFAADAGAYIARVVELRKNGEETYIVINGGRHQFTYHGGVFALGTRVPEISVVRKKQTERKIKANIVGALCTEGDILAKGIELPEVGVGDYIVFHNAGAYCMTECMALFLSRDIPAVFLSDGKISRLRKKKNIMECDMEEM